MAELAGSIHREDVINYHCKDNLLKKNAEVMNRPAPIPIPKPAPRPECTPKEILLGPPVDPLDRIKLYSEDQFESFIAEWAYFYLKELSGKYVQVARFGGAGDKGRDVVAYVSLPPKVLSDVFQCKHYTAPLAPSDIWLELAKLIILENKDPPADLQSRMHYIHFAGKNGPGRAGFYPTRAT